MVEQSVNITASELFLKAENQYKQGDFEKAVSAYLQLTSDEALAPLSYYRLAQIANITNDPIKAKDLYYKALSLKPDLYKDLLPKEHPNHGYIFFSKKDEPPLLKCPLCDKPGEAYWCHSTIEMGSTHVQQYNPVRVWMRCENCNHLYAEEFPEQTVNVNKKINPKAVGMLTRTHLFAYYSEIISRLSQYVRGNELLEIGFGGCESMLVAREMAFNVFGIDISEGNVAQARRYGFDAEIHDFVKFEPDKKWDVLILGDVIEHVSDPVRTVEKTYELLNDDGVLWISTPNFESSFAVVAGHNDPMRKEVEHKNYFSRVSLLGLLERFNYVPVDYRISGHYNGSMEVIAIKECYSKS